jgi:hypothetical protein
MASKNDWWTCPTESEDGRLVMVTGRRDVEKFRDNPRFNIRVEITWVYDNSHDAGMPDVETSNLMEQATNNLTAIFDADPVAILTGIYTGAGERNWVFYTLSTHIFQRKLNEALAELPLLPLQISAENDPNWDEYSEMKSLSEIQAED